MAQITQLKVSRTEPFKRLVNKIVHLIDDNILFYCTSPFISIAKYLFIGQTQTGQKKEKYFLHLSLLTLLKYNNVFLHLEIFNFVSIFAEFSFLLDRDFFLGGINFYMLGKIIIKFESDLAGFLGDFRFI
jgi:hypothetical protein